MARDIGADECFDRIRRSSAVTAAATIGCHTNGSRSLYGFSTGLPVAAVFADLLDRYLPAGVQPIDQSQETGRYGREARLLDIRRWPEVC